MRTVPHTGAGAGRVQGYRSALREVTQELTTEIRPVAASGTVRRGPTHLLHLIECEDGTRLRSARQTGTPLLDVTHYCSPNGADAAPPVAREL